jgi:hypothetical protein
VAKQEEDPAKLFQDLLEALSVLPAAGGDSFPQDQDPAADRADELLAGRLVQDAGAGAAANRPPLTNADFYRVKVGDALRLGRLAGVLANDSDPEGAPLQVLGFDRRSDLLTEDIGNGVLALDVDGSVTFVASRPGFMVYAYRAYDGELFSRPTALVFEVR